MQVRTAHQFAASGDFPARGRGRPARVPPRPDGGRERAGGPLGLAGQSGDALQVIVRDNNVEQALRALKKKLQREGIFREMKQRRAYEKPSERKTREKAEAVRRTKKAARKLAQREGLLPAPKKRVRPDARRPAAAVQA
jgi:small subunit ribosomal protein S21